MKSAREILCNNYGCSDIEELKRFFSFSDKSLAMIIAAMEEYANARLQELSLTDMAEEYIKKELPNAEKPFHYDAEGAVCIRDFVKWARNKLTGK